MWSLLWHLNFHSFLESPPPPFLPPFCAEGHHISSSSSPLSAASPFFPRWTVSVTASSSSSSSVCLGGSARSPWVFWPLSPPPSRYSCGLRRLQSGVRETRDKTFKREHSLVPSKSSTRKFNLSRLNVVIIIAGLGKVIQRKPFLTSVGNRKRAS